MGPRMRLDMERRLWVDGRTRMERVVDAAAEAVAAVLALAAVLLSLWIGCAVWPDSWDELRADVSASAPAERR